MMSRIEMICSRCDWLIPVWMMSMSKRPSSPATLPIQYSTIRTARSASSASPPDLSDLVSFEDVLRELAVAVRLRAIDDREDDVEPAEQRGRQVDLLGDVLVLVEPAELRVRGGEDRAPGLEDGRDACLRDADPLLLHRFVDRRPVLWIHFLDFVDGGEPEIGKDQGSRFEGPSALAEFVPDRGCGQARRRSGLPRRVDSAGGEPDHVGQELALARSRISDQD